ncbi:MAG: protein tyrosine phosphatase family protein [Thiotrichales bacterium]|nr:protein tyrosine phosphatase family protein [Thiotrichales bacterium]
MPDDLAALPNFRAYENGVATSGQPDRTQFSAIGAAGFTVVINLALDDSPGALADEAAVVRECGMQYEHIPVDFRQPQLGDLQRFYAAMDRHGSERCFIHCAYNWRVSAFMYLYRTQLRGVDTSRARQDLEAVWDPDPVWNDFIRLAESADPGDG